MTRPFLIWVFWMLMAACVVVGVCGLVVIRTVDTPDAARLLHADLCASVVTLVVKAFGELK